MHPALVRFIFVYKSYLEGLSELWFLGIHFIFLFFGHTSLTTFYFIVTIFVKLTPLLTYLYYFLSIKVHEYFSLGHWPVQISLKSRSTKTGLPWCYSINSKFYGFYFIFISFIFYFTPFCMNFLYNLFIQICTLLSEV